MEIIIDIDDATPLFTQLMEQIKKAVSNGDVKPGDSLPSIRQLANDLGINNKTVSKAYSLLERDSIIQMKGYRGTYVHPEAVKNCTVDLNKWVIEKLNELVALFRKAGVTDSEMRIAFGKVINNEIK